MKNITAKNSSKGRRYDYAKKSIGSERKEPPEYRKCLGSYCGGKMFFSASKFNRICPTCKVRNAAVNM